MVVYKAVFKIIQTNIPQLVISFGVFLFVTVFLAHTYVNPVNTDFTESKINIAFINHDTNSTLVEGLKDYLNKKANIVDIQGERQKLQDALFFRDVEYIIRVPEGFGDGFLNGREVQIEKTSVPDSTSSLYMDNLINKYLNTAKKYIDNMEDLTEEQLIAYIESDLAQKAEVVIANPNFEKDQNEKRAYYFNYLAYSLFAILILGVSAVMMVFNNEDLKRRNLCSPLKIRNMNYQMIMGNISFAIIAWFIMIFTSFIMYGSFMFTGKGLLFILNSFIFTLSAISISFLIGNIVKSKSAMAAASNVVSLGTSFISGVFVPQALIGENILKLASLTPTYWYVKSNNEIANMISLKLEDIAPIFLNMLVMVGFTLAITAVTLVIIKQKRMTA